MTATIPMMESHIIQTKTRSNPASHPEYMVIYLPLFTVMPVIVTNTLFTARKQEGGWPELTYAA